MDRHVKAFEAQYPNDFVISPHKLCKHCQSLGASSKLLANVPRDYCETVLTAENESDPGLEAVSESHLHATFSELERSYLGGCHLCSHIYERLKFEVDHAMFRALEDHSGSNVPRLEIEVVAEKGIKQCRLELGVFDEVKGRKHSGVAIQVFAANDRRLPPVENPFQGQLVISTASPASIDLARHWLDQCHSNHSACRTSQNSNERQLPSRLIDVGLQGSSPRPRLCVMAEGDAFNIDTQTFWVPYLTLSHCWGKALIFKLTLENINELRCSLPMESLSRTFQDAILVTRLLGYRYLWIDSLCIIQDSAADWQQEAGRMSTVYGNSACTLAALGSSSADGCFKRRNPLFRRPCRLLHTCEADVYAYGFEPLSSLPVGGEDDRADFTLDTMPLLKRAWVLQERMISSRILYFGSPGLYWECCETKASEFWPNGRAHVNRFQENMAVKEAFSSTLRSDILTNSESRESFIRIWNWIVETYTSAGLTYQTDRAIALAGIASKVKWNTQMTYLAGLWQELLPEGLLWSCGRLSTTLPLMDRKSPTWAWLPLDAPIITKEIRNGLNVAEVRRLRTAKVVGIGVSTSRDPRPNMGEEEGASIKIRSLIRKLSGPVWNKVERIWTAYGVDEELDMKFSFLPDVELSGEMSLHFLLIQSAAYKVKHHPSPPWGSQYEDEVQEQGLVLLPLLQEQQKKPMITTTTLGNDGAHELVWDSTSFVRIGYFSNIYQASWPKDSPLIFGPDSFEPTVCIY